MHDSWGMIKSFISYLVSDSIIKYWLPRNWWGNKKDIFEDKAWDFVPVSGAHAVKNLINIEFVLCCVPTNLL